MLSVSICFKGVTFLKVKRYNWRTGTAWSVGRRGDVPKVWRTTLRAGARTDPRGGVPDLSKGKDPFKGWSIEKGWGLPLTIVCYLRGTILSLWMKGNNSFRPHLINSSVYAHFWAEGKVGKKGDRGIWFFLFTSYIDNPKLKNCMNGYILRGETKLFAKQVLRCWQTVTRPMHHFTTWCLYNMMFSRLIPLVSWVHRKHGLIISHAAL